MAEKDQVPVSVVVPCYNCAGTIRRALESVAQQTQRPAEVIIVNDGSTDDSRKVVDALQDRYGSGWLRVIDFAQNCGAATARNRGWEAASQEYIALLDADDAWHPKKLEIQLRYMRNNDLVLSGHDHALHSAKSERQTAGGVRGVRRIEILLRNPFVTPSVMFKRSLPVRFRDGKRHVDDHLLWMSIVLRGYKTGFIEDRLVTIYKPLFGAGGLSGQLWKMERGELGAYWQVYRQGLVGFVSTAFLFMFSLAKFGRRLLLVGLRRVMSGGREIRQTIE